MSSKTVADKILESSGAAPATWTSTPLLEKITGIVPSIIYIFNQQTQANEYSNRSIGSSLGYSSEEILEMGDALFPRLCHEEDLPKIASHFQSIQTMADGDVSTVEYRMKHRNGRWIWLLSHDTVFERDESGLVLRHIGTATDITDQKEAEIKALAATRELRNFAYSVSHDLKSPSNTLSMLITEIQQSHSSQLDTEGHQLLELSTQTIERMQNVITDVMSYTGVVNEEPIFEPVNLNEVIQHVLNDLKSELIDCSADIACGELPEVLGIPTQIHQLFQNLIDNSLKYRQADVPPKIEIRETSVSRLPGASISVDVSDNGIGIPEDKLDSVFDIFHRLHGHETYPHGSGLGLAICKRIALTHNAQLSVKSLVGQGSTFTVSFEGFRQQ